jgi:hypothetical protein
MKNLVPGLSQDAFGAPATGTTRYDICIYDDDDTLVAGIDVDRAGDLCDGNPCWKALGAIGFKYSDKDVDTGIKGITAAGGPPGKGQVVVTGSNNVVRGQNGLPTGIAPALDDDTAARVQVITDDAACFEALFGTIKQSDPTQFKAAAP